MFKLCTLPIFLGILIQASVILPLLEDILSPGEKARLEHARNIDGRIKVYEAVSKRIQKDLRAAVSNKEFQTVPRILKQWTALLSESFNDIEANLKGQKKPRSLKNFEIQIRKAISDTQNYKMTAPISQQDIFDSCLTSAEAIRKRLVDIYFQN